jgi:hypothetical protein
MHGDGTARSLWDSPPLRVLPEVVDRLSCTPVLGLPLTDILLQLTNSSDSELGPAAAEIINSVGIGTTAFAGTAQGLQLVALVQQVRKSREREQG